MSVLIATGASDPEPHDSGSGGRTITKKELIDRIADETGQRRVTVKKTLQQFLDHVIDELAAGNRLEFRDFGVFEVRTRAARTAQNPKTMDPVDVPEKRAVKFKAGRLMRERLDQPASTAPPPGPASPPPPNSSDTIIEPKPEGRPSPIEE
ncbi:MAG: HU family DNA-binding protein [Planctomycetota bacterium]